MMQDGSNPPDNCNPPGSPSASPLFFQSAMQAERNRLLQEAIQRQQAIESNFETMALLIERLSPECASLKSTDIETKKTPRSG